MTCYKTSISIWFLLCLILFSCTSKDEKSDKIFNRINEGLKMSNKNLESENVTIYMRFKNKLADPTTRERALIWEPKSALIRENSKEVRDYIDSLQTIISNAKISMELSTALLLKLQSYQDNVISVDTELAEILKREKFNPENYFQTKDSKETFYESNFKNNSTPMISAVLYNFANNVNLLENVALSFFDNKSCVIIDRFDVFSVIVGQSSNTVAQGDEIEINAGVGAFSRAASPIIYIDGKNIELDESAVANYKFKATGNAGKHTIPVKITYIDPSGEKQSKSIDISYKIRE